MNINLFCRVCGLEQDEPPWGEDNKNPTRNICHCCGIEFGYEDCTVSAAKSNRQSWIEKGAKWFRPKEMPKDWDLAKQMENIPPEIK